MNKEQLKQLIKEELQTVLNEDGHTDVASARRQLALAIEDSKQMLDALANLPGEGDLPSWWMKKVTLSSAYLNGARDYLLTMNEAKDTKEDFEPHMMYDPETGAGIKAKTYEDHIELAKKGYVHDNPLKEEMEIRSMDAGEQRRKCARLKKSHDRAMADAYTDPRGYGEIEVKTIERMAAKFDCEWLR